MTDWAQIERDAENLLDKSLGRCPHCHVRADDALEHGHRPGCPNHASERARNNGAAPDDEDRTVIEHMRRRLHVGAAVCNLPPLRPLIDGLLFLPGESAIYAPPKRAKTFYALALGLAVATGQPFMGRNVTQGPVLFVAAEGIGGLGARVAAWRTHAGISDIDQAMFLTTAVNLFDPVSVAAFTILVEEHQPILIVIDTLARCSVGADENTAKDMGRIVGALDTIRSNDRHIALVHHAGKDTTKGLRGSNSLLGAVDTVLEITGDTHALKITVTDQKDAEAPPPSWCRLERVADSAVIVPISEFDVITGAQRLVLDALELLPEEDRTASKWQQIAEEGGVSRSTFFEAKKALLIRGRVTGGEGRGSRYAPVEEP